MALGFQDCCNEYSFFYLDSTPAYVTEFEFYSIQTAQGFTLCGKYREVPTLNYTPPTYTLVEMTEYENCDNCIAANPCPVDELILSNQFIQGSVAEGQDCNFTTIIQMVVEPLLINPTEFNSNDGRVAFNIVGGTQPYIFYDTDTQQVLPVIQVGDLYIVYDNVPEGSYLITITDSNGDFTVSQEYFLDAPPSPPTVICAPTNATFFGANDGSINLNISEGTPPYTVIYQGGIIELPLTGLFAGNYNFQIQDQNFTIPITCEITEPVETNFPNELCLNFVFCSNTIRLNFSRQGPLYNFRPQYNAVYPQLFGLTQMTIRYEISSNRWETTTETCNPANIQFVNPPGNCNYGNNQVKFVANPSSQPSTLWSGSAGMVQGLVANVGSFFCPPTAIFVSATDYCAGPPAILSSVVVAANGGSGPPYTYSYSTGGGVYIDSFTPLLSLAGGNYSLRVTDSDGNQSSPINFTVPTRVFRLEVNQTPPTYNSCAIYRRNFSGQVTGDLQDGESRTANFEADLYFDFLPFPDDVSFEAQFRVSFDVVSTAGGPGYTNPQDYQKTRLEVYEAYVLNDGTRTNFMENPVESSFQPTGIPLTNFVAGTNINYGVNAGGWYTERNTDNCGTGIIRTSPNYWKDCDNLANFGSLNEGDLVGINWYQGVDYKGSFVTINKNTKMAIKLRFTVELFAPKYSPPVINEAGPSALIPTSYTPLGASKLNTPNTPPLNTFNPGSIIGYTIFISNVRNRQGCFQILTLVGGGTYSPIAYMDYQSYKYSIIRSVGPAPADLGLITQPTQAVLRPAVGSCGATPPSWAL